MQRIPPLDTAAKTPENIYDAVLTEATMRIQEKISKYYDFKNTQKQTMELLAKEQDRMEDGRRKKRKKNPS